MISYILRRPLLLFALIGGGALLAELATSTPQEMQSVIVATQQQRVKKVIVFDMGGVLGIHTETSFGLKATLRAIQQNGLSSIFSIGDITNRKEIKPLYFKIIEAAAHYPTTLERMYDDQDAPCPAGTCALNAGLITLAELRANALHVIDTMLAEDNELEARGCPRVHFKNNFQASFLRNLIEILLDETTLARSYKKLPGAKILRKLLERSDVEIMILSNFAVEQFGELTKRLAKVFKDIPEQNIFVSGMELPTDEFGTDFSGSPYKLAVKPNSSAFDAIKQVCKKRWGVEAYDIIMIDNQRKNIHAAQEAGLVGYLVNAETEGAEYNHTFDELRDVLLTRDLVPAEHSN